MQYEKRGYLLDDFKIFSLSDSRAIQYNFHYHDFHKILLFIKGNVTYHIEGKAYRLEPYDIVLVPSGDVHKPVLNDNSVYERVIIYISDLFLEHFSTKECNLRQFIEYAGAENTNVVRYTLSGEAEQTASVINELLKTLSFAGFGSELLQKALLLELLVRLNRICLDDAAALLRTDTANPHILTVLEYINRNLSEDLSIAAISDKFFMDKYYLMHLFKKETGFTIGNYITCKRLSRVDELIKRGLRVTEACFECGFKNYSTFSRAYKKYYNASPRMRLKD